MMMRLANGVSKTLAVLAVLLCMVCGAWAQNPPAKKARRAKAKAAAAQAKAASAAAAPGAQSETAAPKGEEAKRDPFVPLVSDKKDSGALHLPPGKAGLVIATVRIDGTVQSGKDMIAVVSNPEERVYFIREGDRLYDGDVEKISLEGVTFKENSKDAFGKPVERMVTKRIYASAGEQQ
jgi:Tfp pilus assembly protein PilP